MVARGHRVRVLLVDDDATVCDALRLVLESEGYAVEIAADGVQALASCAADPPDLVVCDIFMPNMDGLATIRELRRRCPRVRVYCMSGGGTTGLKTPLQVAAHVGADRTAWKPVAAAEFLSAVRDLVGPADLP
jgi:CheY-like chemotaxis protein